MKFPRLVALPLILAACASTAEIPESRTDRSIVSMTGAAGPDALQLTRDAAITSDSVTATPDQVWAVVPQVYAQLEHRREFHHQLLHERIAREGGIRGDRGPAGGITYLPILRAISSEARTSIAGRP